MPVTPVQHGRVEIVSDDEVTVLHQLTGWALERGVALDGLSVDRPSLEDVYLALTEESDVEASA